MGKGFFKVPAAKNEAVLSYAPGSEERKNVLKKMSDAVPGRRYPDVDRDSC